jgi:hypothetical protein
MDFSSKLKETIYLKKYTLSLSKRIHLLKIDYAKKNTFEKNESMIIELETLMKINKADIKIKDNEIKLFLYLNKIDTINE